MKKTYFLYSIGIFFQPVMAYIIDNMCMVLIEERMST